MHEMCSDDMVATFNVLKRLQQDAEWLKSFEESLQKSERLKNEIVELLGNFQDRLVQLDQSIVPLHEKTALLQRKQANIRKMLKTIDAMQQFYGRAAELENSIREGNVSVDREGFIERMDRLDEAISFFSTHPTTYQQQLDSMKLTFESGCCALEKEFKNVLSTDSVIVDGSVIIEYIDSEYEVLSARLHEVTTLRNPERCAQLASWLLAHNAHAVVVQAFSNTRVGNMMRTLASIFEQDKTSDTKTTPKSSVSFKQALRKATGRSSERYGSVHEWRTSDGVIDNILMSFGVLLALVGMETDAIGKVISDVSIEAKVQQAIFGRPLHYVVSRAMRLLDSLECSLIPLLPLLKHINTHYVQFASLANNAVDKVPYDTFVAKVQSRAVAALDDFLDRLANDPNKFVPSDGNVHQITSNALNFLSSLMEYRQTVTTLLSATGAKGNQSTQFPRLFARTLSALGLNLKNKAEFYVDETLAAIFLLNNNNYIHNALQNHGMFSVVCEHNSQVQSYYRSEIEVYTNKYLQSWNRLVSIITVDVANSEDKQALKNAIFAFNTELEKLVNTQQDYCLSDVKLMHDLKSRIKALICDPYSKICAQTMVSSSKSMEKYLRYTPESLAVTIDRLFDVAG